MPPVWGQKQSAVCSRLEAEEKRRERVPFHVIASV